MGLLLFFGQLAKINGFEPRRFTKTKPFVVLVFFLRFENHVLVVFEYSVKENSDVFEPLGLTRLIASVVERLSNDWGIACRFKAAIHEGDDTLVIHAPDTTPNNLFKDGDHRWDGILLKAIRPLRERPVHRVGWVVERQFVEDDKSKARSFDVNARKEGSVGK